MNITFYLVLSIIVVCEIIAIAMWRKKTTRYILLFLILIFSTKLIYKYLDNTFDIRYGWVFEIDSDFKKDFINDINKLSSVQKEKITKDTISNMPRHILELRNDFSHLDLEIEYPEFFMSDEQKITIIINRFFQKWLSSAKFKGINFSCKSEIGYFLYIAIDLPDGKIYNDYIHVDKNFIQMFISIDKKIIVWNNN